VPSRRNRDFDGAQHCIAVGQLTVGEIAETRRVRWIDDVESDARVRVTDLSRPESPSQLVRE